MNLGTQPEKTEVRMSPKLKKNPLSKQQKNKMHAYLFVLPAMLFFLFMIAYPLITVVWDSFHFKNLLNSAESAFAGFDNYITVIRNENFSNALSNTVIWTVLSVAGEFILGLISAIALNQQIKGRAIFRGVIIIPWVVPIVVAGMTWTWMLTPDYGILNYLLTKGGIIDKPYYWLGEMNSALLTVTFVNIWRSFPYYTICILAALQSIPKELLEAASIDGAGVMNRFFKVVLPQLKGVSFVLIFIHLIWTSINFDFIWVMTEGGPLNSTETLPIMIYRYALKEFDVGTASSLASMMIGFMITIFVVNYYYNARKKQA
ncbi:carbohydrate ABC transporter permease [Peribacillus simplex]|nr:sugar ABC transporter permease [Peribacillus simplex]MEC1398662.1 sugar ABC transporter permease [Peribacillus simplex]